MALIAKVGGRESNSLLTLSEAESRLKLLPYTETSGWEDLDTQQKEYRLQLAAMAMLMLPLRGYRSYEGQAQSFPRSVQDDETIIPDCAKDVQAQIAVSVIHRALLSKQSVSDGEVSAKSVSKVSLGGLLAVSFDSSPSKTGTFLEQLSRSIEFPTYLMLVPYLTSFRGGSVLNTDELPVLLTTTTTTSTTMTTTTT